MVIYIVSISSLAVAMWPLKLTDYPTYPRLTTDLPILGPWEGLRFVKYQIQFLADCATSKYQNNQKVHKTNILFETM